MFIIGREYTRDEIHEQLDGSKVSCLPTLDGKIVAACLSLKFSPAAPTVVLCGQGQKTTAVSKLLTLQQGNIPVFVKKAVSHWAYCGVFQVIESLSVGTRFEQFIIGSGRSIESVSYVVIMQRSK